MCISSSSLSQVKILQATGLPRHLSNFVFCQYHFWGQEEPVFIAPEVAPSSSSSDSRDPQCTVVFDNAKVTQWNFLWSTECHVFVASLFTN